jgi:putative transposase
MAHTCVSGLVHYVFSTKERRNLIPAEIQPKLWAYIGGIARNNGMKALVVGGTENHVHVLLSLSSTVSIAKAVQLIKGGSSKWFHEQFGGDFAWQTAYGAFTLGISQKVATIAYVQSQPQHHKKRTFEEEFIAFLKKHEIEYDPEHLWG